jgi:hypothetical protein
VAERAVKLLKTYRKRVAPTRAGTGDGMPCRGAAASASLRLSIFGGIRMTITLAHLSPLVALLAGILILIMPRLLNFIIAIYLIFVGVTGLWPRLLH